MRNKKVLVLLYNYFTHDSRVLKECTSLIKAGYDVDLWALYKDDLAEKETIDGINVHRRPGVMGANTQKPIVKTEELLQDHKISKINRLKSWKTRLKKYMPTIYHCLWLTNRIFRRFLLYFSCKGYYFLQKYSIYKLIFIKGNPEIFADFKQNNYSFIHCNDITPLKLSVDLKLANPKVKIVYDCHEYQSEERPIGGLKNWLIKKAIQFLEKKYINHVDAVITVSDGIAKEYVRLYRIKKPALVLNCPKYTKLIEPQDLFRKKLKINKDQTIFLYQGGFTSGRGIENIIDAFKQMHDSKMVIVFMGYGPLDSMIKEAASETNKIYYFPAVAPNVLLDYTASADIGILWYENNCLNQYYCLPNKLFEYLMAGIPSIVSNLYEIEKFTIVNKTGVVTEEISTEGLISAIEKISKMDLDVLKRNVSVAREVYNWENQEKVLLDVYSRL